MKRRLLWLILGPIPKFHSGATSHNFGRRGFVSESEYRRYSPSSAHAIAGPYCGGSPRATKFRPSARQLILVWVLIIAGILLVPSRSRAATLFISPSSGISTVGQTMTVTVKVNAAGQAINASEGTITWTAALSLKSVSSSGSIFQFWAVQPSGSDVTGRVIFSGGLPNPGYSGTSGTIIRLTFTAKSTGAAAVQVAGGKVLANDGQGTDVLTSQGRGSYTIKATAVIPPPAPSLPNRPTPTLTVSDWPDQSSWYRSDRATLAFSRPSGLEGVSYLLDQQSTATPPEIVNAPSGPISLTIVGDGVWYVHLRGKYAAGWSATAHYVLRRDTAPPDPFTLTLERDGLSDPAPQLVFSTRDATSGVATYSLVVDGAAAKEVASPTILTLDQSGRHRVEVTAVDAAGNGTAANLEFETVGYPAPTVTSISSPLLLLDSLVVRGTTNAGDKVTVYVNGRSVGEVIAGPADPNAQAQGVTIKTPWILTSDRLFRPGTYQVTAAATSADGQSSVITKPLLLRVVGQAMLLRGRPVLTISVVTPLAILAVSLLAAIIGVMTRLWLAVRLMHRRVDYAEEELEALQEFSDHQTVTRSQLDSALRQIEIDLGREPRPPVAKRRGRRPSRS